MKYFNKAFLKNILTRYKSFTVFVNSEHLSIVDISDIDDGVGYSSDGMPKRFECRDITEIAIGNSIYTLDMLNPEPEKEDSEDDNEDDNEDETKPEKSGKEETPTEPKKREESIYAGSKVTILSESYGVLKGIVKHVYPHDNMYDVNVYNIRNHNFEKFVVERKEIISVD
jgi:hypothetical protein